MFIYFIIIYETCNQDDQMIYIIINFEIQITLKLENL